jgi:hypothetical protein
VKTFHCGFWKTPFVGFRFVLNTSATHHNPIICTNKKQNARQRPVKNSNLPKEFWRKISSENFKSAENQKEKRRRRRPISQNLQGIFSKQKFFSFTYDSI